MIPYIIEMTPFPAAGRTYHRKWQHMKSKDYTPCSLRLPFQNILCKPYGKHGIAY